MKSLRVYAFTKLTGLRAVESERKASAAGIRFCILAHPFALIADTISALTGVPAPPLASSRSSSSEQFRLDFRQDRVPRHDRGLDARQSWAIARKIAG